MVLNSNDDLEVHSFDEGAWSLGQKIQWTIWRAAERGKNRERKREREREKERKKEREKKEQKTTTENQMEIGNPAGDLTLFEAATGGAAAHTVKKSKDKQIKVMTQTRNKESETLEAA